MEYWLYLQARELSERDKGIMSRRGYAPEDEKQFTGRELKLLQKAADEVQFLLDRGYDVKPVTTFVGNHYMFSERQRLALARSVSAKEYIQKRMNKELLQMEGEYLPEMVHVDGFNTIITLEVALSGSLLLEGMDGTIRDLAGLRGSYRIVDKTVQAVELVLHGMEEQGVKSALFYLDQQVSNSGRLRGLILEKAADRGVQVQVELHPGVDSVLSRMENVVTADAIILDKCGSWYNLNRGLMEKAVPDAWIFRLDNFRA